MTIGKNIMKARKSANMTQQELAEKLGISYTLISQYERGQRNPKIETLQRIAAALGCAVYDLFSIEQLSVMSTNEVLGMENELLDKPKRDLAIARGLTKEAFLCNLDFIFDDKQEFFDCMNDLSDLTRNELLQIWDYAKWVMSKRATGGDTDAT